MITQPVTQLASLESSQLPIVPAGVSELIAFLSKDEPPFYELAKVIERFPSITARLIVLANSAWSNPSSPVENLTTACSRLGFNVVRNVSIALVVASPFSVHNCPAFNIAKYWCRSLLTADIAYKIASVGSQKHLMETARTAGLLHNLGLLWMTDRLPALIQETFVQHQANHNESLQAICMQKIGFGYVEAGAYLGREWGLPEILVDAIANQHSQAQDIESETSVIVSQAIAVAQLTEEKKSDKDPDSLFEIPEKQFPMQDEVIDFAAQKYKQNHDLASALFNF